MKQEKATMTSWGVDEFDAGVMLGILIAHGHFGGDRTQPQISLRLHARHKPLLEWLLDRCPGARLYGPYTHDQRNYYQFMVRGNALCHRLVPLLDTLPWSTIDSHSYERYQSMKVRYALTDSDAPDAG